MGYIDLSLLGNGKAGLLFTQDGRLYEKYADSSFKVPYQHCGTCSATARE